MTTTYITTIMLLAFAGLAALFSIVLLLRQLRTILKDLADDVDLIRSAAEGIERSAIETNRHTALLAGPMLEEENERAATWRKALWSAIRDLWVKPKRPTT